VHPTVRPYEPRDLERCRDLWRSLTQRHRDLYEDPTLGGPDPGLALDEHLKLSELHRLWVAELDDRLLGFCALLVRGDESELEPIVVDPRERGRGVGALLAREAIAESRRLGVRYVNVRPVARNVEAMIPIERALGKRMSLSALVIGSDVRHVHAELLTLLCRAQEAVSASKVRA
jgi:GNAT superfamily N-acetyltransferase